MPAPTTNPAYQVSDYFENMVVHGSLEVKGGISYSSIILPTSSLNETAPPTVNDDDSQGFSVGS